MDNNQNLSGRGGKREGAGRPHTDKPAIRRTIRLTDEDFELFNKKGGVKWLREQLHS